MNRLAHAFRLALLLALGVLVLVPGCRRQSRILVPNRVLDRPIDVALAWSAVPGWKIGA